MKRLVATMACGALLAAVDPAGALAQAPKAAPAAAAPKATAPAAAGPAAGAPAAAAPAPAAVAPAAVAAAPAAAASPPAARGKKRSWTRADARVCLEFPTNLQIIRCAEKYRYSRVPA
jgi:hypothetical protein